jgi:hypothetical protein
MQNNNVKTENTTHENSEKPDFDIIDDILKDADMEIYEFIELIEEEELKVKQERIDVLCDYITFFQSNLTN